MKRFTQSLIGKIVLFAGTVILTCVLAASIILTAFLFSADFYTSSEREVYDSFIRSHLSGDGYRLTAQVIGASEAGSVADFEKTADGKAFLIESGNLIYEIRDQKDTLLATSGKQDQIHSGPYIFQYTRILENGQYNGLFYGNEEDYRNIHFPGEEETEAADSSVEVFTFRAGLPGLMTEVDYYSFMAKAVHLAYVLRYWIFAIALFVLAALAVCFIALMTASARVYGQEELKPGLVIGESMGAIHALAVSGVPHLLVSPSLNAPIFFSILQWLVLIPGVTALCDRIWKPKEGERQPLHFDWRHLHAWKGFRRRALAHSPKCGGKDSFFAFFGTRDHYRRSGIVRVRTWRKYYGDTFRIYDGTHFMEEEYIDSLLIPKILEITDNITCP